MESTQTSIDSMLRRFDENRTRHDEFQRSLEELKDMVRTLLVMETGSSSFVRSVPIKVTIPPHRRPVPSTQDPGSNLGANLEEQNCEMVYSSTKVSDATVESNEGVTGFSHCGSVDIQSKNDTAHKLLIHSYSSCHEAIEDSVTDEDRQILCVSSMEDSSPSKPEDDLRKIEATINTSTQEIVPSKVAQVGDGLFLDAHNLLEEMPMGDGSAKLQEMDNFEPLKVTSLPLLEVSDCESEDMSEWVVDPVESTGFSWGDVNITSTEILGNFSAHKVFVRMLKRKTEINNTGFSLPVVHARISDMSVGTGIVVVDNMIFVFDPGDAFDHGATLLDSGPTLMSSGVKDTMEVVVVAHRLQWDPGGLFADFFCMLQIGGSDVLAAYFWQLVQYRLLRLDDISTFS